MNKRTAICIPAYNEEKHISKTIQSILNQTHTNFDLLISENFSSDRTKEIILEFTAVDERVKLLQPPCHCKSLANQRFLIDEINAKDYEYSIFLGGHDIIDTLYVELLIETQQNNPDAAIIVGRGIEIDTQEKFLRDWPEVIQLKGGHISSRPLTVLTSLYYNVAAFGLWTRKSRSTVKYRHDCMCSDHFYVAEASLHGDIITDPRAIIYTRRTDGVGEREIYFKKHVSEKMDASNMVADFENQIEWLCHLNDLAYVGFPNAIKNILLAGSAGIYFSLYGMNNMKSVDGALEKWLSSDSGLAIASQLNTIGASIRQNTKKPA